MEKRGSDIKSGEYDNSNNTIIKITGLRHKLENKEMSMKEQMKNIDNR